MPKGAKRSPGRAAAMHAVDTARAELLTQMFSTLSPYVVGCAKTVGILGAMSAEGKPGHLTAAMKVLEFVAAHAGSERDEALESLLSAIAEIRSAEEKATGD